MVWRVHRLESQIGKKRLLAVRLAAQVFDQLVGIIGRRVEIIRQADRLTILDPGRAAGRQVMLGLPVVGSAFQQRHRAVKAPGIGQTLRSASQVPLARHVGTITGILQQGRQGHGLVVEPGLVTGLAFLVVGHDFLHVAHTDLVTGDASHQHGPGRGAGGSHVEVAELQAFSGQRIDMRCADLPAIGPRVGEPHIVGDNQQDVGTSVRQDRQGYTEHESTQ